MGNQMNPMQIVQMLKSGINPQQLAIGMIEQRIGSTPMGANLLNLARDNKTAEIEMFARNYCKERGVDFDKEFNCFKNNLGIK